MKKNLPLELDVTQSAEEALDADGSYGTETCMQRQVDVTMRPEH